MLAKDKYSLESIIESIDRILEYTSGLQSADELNADYRNFDATMMNFVVTQDRHSIDYYVRISYFPRSIFSLTLPRERFLY